MFVKKGHLTYCTNIHAGETWQSHFEALKTYIPAVKKHVSPEAAMGIGLRLSNEASLELIKPTQLAAFKEWLHQNQLYVFTMNGFPYGAFHQTKVKDQVHTPDWCTRMRVDYTIRLLDILNELLPEDLEGGVSTSPLSYRHWHGSSKNRFKKIKQEATLHIVEVVQHLMNIQKIRGNYLHLDIEPEPDGLLESGDEFLDWYLHDLLPIGIPMLSKVFNLTPAAAEEAIKKHICLCYDICHFALGYESHEGIIKRIRSQGIQIGKIQISAAIKAKLPPLLSTRMALKTTFEVFNENTYLHQVIAKTTGDALIRYRDLPEALLDLENMEVDEWRAHYHVPLFVETYGNLESTREDIKEVLKIYQRDGISKHLEVETYTWDVLPNALKQPLVASIAREINWVNDQLI